MAKKVAVKVSAPKGKKDLVATITKEISPFVSQANEVVVKNEADKVLAVSLLSELNTFNDRVVEDREKITKPLNAALKEVRAKYKPLESQLEEAIDIVRNKLSVFQTEQMREQKRIAAEQAAKVAEGTATVEDAVAALEEAPAVPESVKTAAGDVTFKTVQKLKVVDAALIPREFLDVNEKKVLDALKAGIVVAGAEIEEVQVPINYRG